jgi:cysteine synthase B
LTEVGLFVGLSSGAIMAGAVKCAATVPDDLSATIVMVAPDDGWKYLSTGAWSDDIDVVVERAKSTIYF